MDPESFKMSTWHVLPLGLKIWVSEGKRTSFNNDDFEMVVLGFRKSGPEGAKYARCWASWAGSLIRRQEQDDDDDDDKGFYTYVALNIEEMVVQLTTGEWVALVWKHHITLAYLPRMSPDRSDQFAKS